MKDLSKFKMVDYSTSFSNVKYMKSKDMVIMQPILSLLLFIQVSESKSTLNSTFEGDTPDDTLQPGTRATKVALYRGQVVAVKFLRKEDLDVTEALIHDLGDVSVFIILFAMEDTPTLATRGPSNYSGLVPGQVVAVQFIRKEDLDVTEALIHDLGDVSG